MKNIVVSWFSAGVSSAVATKIALKQYPDMRIIYTHIDDQHEDTLRFVSDCEKWFNKKIEILQSPYKNVDNAVSACGVVNTPRGANCTTLLKRRVRKEWERENGDKADFIYVWGFDYAERARADRVQYSAMPESEHFFPLIENYIDKQAAHGILEKAGIKRPYMYELGYPNNNCIGCIKGGAGYWNKIRQDFPEVFKARCALERKIGGTCLKGVFLDELPEDAGRDLKIIVPDCGLFCEVSE